MVVKNCRYSCIWFFMFLALRVFWVRIFSLALPSSFKVFLKRYNSGGSRVRGSGGSDPPPPPSDLTFVWDWSSYMNRIVYHFLTGWAFYSRNIQKCNCFWVPSYDLFASARKAVFPSPAATGVHRLRKRWLSLWEVICHKKVQQAFLNQSLDPLIKNSWIRPCVIENSRISWNPFCAIPVLAL